MRRPLRQILPRPRLVLPLLLAASGLASYGLTACGAGRDAGGSRTIEYSLSSDPASLDPALSTDVQTGEVVALLFDNLVQFDADGEARPGLAARWGVDSSGAVYTFHLRPGPTFHDGRAIRAADVAASITRALAPGSRAGRQWPLLPIAGARAYAGGEAKSVTGIRTPDDSTVVFTLEEPLNIFPKFLAMPVAAVVPTPTLAGFDQRPVGSGPWRFVSWNHDDALVLARNERYWGGAPAMDSLRIRIIPEPLTQAAEYESGGLSVVEIPFSETRRWEQSRPDELQRRPAIRDLYVAINTTRGPLADARVRRALNHAVDVETLLRTAMAGRGVRAAGAVPPGIVGHDSARAPYAYDPARAKRLLADAGHARGFPLQLWRTKRAELARLAQTIQQDLAAVGIRVEIVERDAASARAAVRNGEADLFLTDWYADYPDPENFNYPLFHSRNRGSGGNYAFLAEPRLDSLILRARATADTAEKARLSREIDAHVFELAPWIFLWFPTDLWAAQSSLEGWRIPLIFNGQRWTGVTRKGS
jgi:ABC-type transport system substrate-binding protein